MEQHLRAYSLTNCINYCAEQESEAKQAGKSIKLLGWDPSEEHNNHIKPEAMLSMGTEFAYKKHSLRY